MEVIIDGIEYTPKNKNGVVVKGIEYENVGHWLFNVEANLLHNFVEACRIAEIKGVNKDNDELVKSTHDAIDEFEMFCKKYLGFERKGSMYFFEI